MKIAETWEVFKQNPLRFWQVAGALGIVLAYIFFVKEQAWWGWAALILVGFIELITIFVYSGTITRFVRNIVGTTWDRIILLALIPLTWWWAGELAAGFFLLGLLNSHFHEKD